MAPKPLLWLHRGTNRADWSLLNWRLLNHPGILAEDLGVWRFLASGWLTGNLLPRPLCTILLPGFFLIARTGNVIKVAVTACITLAAAAIREAEIRTRLATMRVKRAAG
jgi:hypothetical protein